MGGYCYIIFQVTIIVMIDLPTEKDMNSPHHRRAVWALIMASVIGVLLVATYVWKVQDKSEVVDTSYDALATQKRLMDIPSEKVNLTPEQVVIQKKLMDVPSQKVNLTPEQVELQKKLMGI
jgi:hypothetical protein